MGLTLCSGVHPRSKCPAQSRSSSVAALADRLTDPARARAGGVKCWRTLYQHNRGKSLAKDAPSELASIQGTDTTLLALQRRRRSAQKQVSYVCASVDSTQWRICCYCARANMAASRDPRGFKPVSILEAQGALGKGPLGNAS
jgi:hypothetical protein